MNLVKDYEVYGCWSHEEAENICPRCASKLKLVPEEGHYNSKFWKFKRNDGLDLYCCPDGCNTDFNKFIVENFRPINENILKHFYMMHNIEIPEDDGHFEIDLKCMVDNHTSSWEEHKKKVNYIFLKDFVFNYGGFRKFHDEYFDNKSDVEFLIDTMSGLVFFNISSHEPFASWLYGLIYREKCSDEEMLERATKEGKCIWKSTVSSEIFGLENADKLIKAKFK